MKNIGYHLFAVFTLLIVLSCATVNRTETAVEVVNEVVVEEKVEDTIQITGRIVIFGNEPFIYAGIVAEDGLNYAIYPEETERELMALQGYLIEFTVIPMEEEKVYGSLFLRGGTVKPISWEIVR
jgi:hypothetical protein